MGGGDQPADVLDGENLRQGPSTLGTFQNGGGVIAPVSLRIKETVELPQRREPAGDGRRLEAASRKICQIGAQFRRSRPLEPRAEGGEEQGEIVQVTAIGVQRVGARATLHRLHVEEQRERARRAHLLNLSFGTVKVASRRMGSTLLASHHAPP